MATSDDLKTMGSPVFNRLFLTTHSGQQVDLVPLLAQMNIYEDMFAPVLTGDITIMDAKGLWESAPIIGGETITSKVFAWNYSLDNDPLNFLHRTFTVIRISDVVQLNDYTKKYTLHFASPELLKNDSFKLSKAYASTTISNVISTLMTEDYDGDEPSGLSFPTGTNNSPFAISPFLNADSVEAKYQKADENDTVELFVEKTKYIEPYISFPYMRPFDIMNWLASRSIRNSPGRTGTQDTEAANFLFFENKRGFQFTCLDTLLEGKANSTTTFVYGDAQQNRVLVTAGQIDERTTVTETINNLSIQNCYDVLGNLRSGMYASRLYTYDISTGELNYNDYNYLDSFPKTENTETASPQGSFAPISQANDLVTKVLSNRMLAIVTPSVNVDNITSEQTQRNSDAKAKSGVSEYLQQRLSQLARINNFTLLFEISANSKHKVGDCVQIDIKQWNIPDTGINTADIQETSSKYYSGYYLITSIRHSITPYEYKMYLEGVKDAYRTKIA